MELSVSGHLSAQKDLMHERRAYEHVEPASCGCLVLPHLAYILPASAMHECNM